MEFKIKSYNHYRSETKYNIALVYAIVSMVACVFYSISFIIIGANLAAFVQLMGGFVFMTVVGLLRRRFQKFTRYIAICTSLALVFVQSTFVFGKDYGFQYQLFALLVVIFLLLDFNILYERISIYCLSALTIAVFFICEWATFDLVFVANADYATLYFTITLLVSFIGLIVVLYYLSIEIFSAKDQLYNMATTDSLTNLNNRRSFLKRGEEYFKVAERGGNTFSVIIYDIDSFKPINDEYGHLVGDRVLKDISDVSRETVRETDFLARYGGEEFAILLPNTTSEQAYVVAEKLRARIAEHTVVVSPYKIQRTISLGVMAYHYSIGSFDDLVDKADKAMYKSKSNGKNKTTTFDLSDPFYKEKRQVYGV